MSNKSLESGGRQFLKTSSSLAATSSGDSELIWRSATDVLKGLKKKEFHLQEYVNILLARSQQLSSLNAYIHQNPSQLEALAKTASDNGVLRGIPVAVKDVIDVVGMPTSGGTPRLRDWRPERNAQVIDNLLAGGALIAGKANLHELAFGITSNNEAYGAVGNPYNPQLIAGGSSGGSAAAVASGMVPLSLGTDTAGSSRIPAALCGCVGLRPSHGRYSQRGVLPLCSTRDTVGVMARTVEDIALLDGIVSSQPAITGHTGLAGARIGVPRQYFYEDLEAAMDPVIEHALKLLRDAGAELIEVDIADIEALNSNVSLPLVLFEVLRDISMYLNRHRSDITAWEIVEQMSGATEKSLFAEQFSDQAISGELHREVLSVHRPALQRAYASYFSDNRLQALVVPTTPLSARPIGHDDEVDLNGKPVPTLFSYIRNTDPTSNAGLPSMTVPAGLTKQGLPVGISFEGPFNSDGVLMNLAQEFERLRGAIPRPQVS